MKKKVLGVVLTAAMCMALAAPALADVQVAFSQIGQESDWRTANTDSINGTIEAHEGWELIYDDAQQKQENQIKALRNSRNRKTRSKLFATSSLRTLTTSCSPALFPPVGRKFSQK